MKYLLDPNKCKFYKILFFIDLFAFFSIPGRGRSVSCA